MAKAFAVLSLLLFTSSPSVAQLLALSPYLSFNDSPFAGTDFGGGYFFLENGDDGLINVPGVIATSNTRGTTLGIRAPETNTDSVDGDDGSIDGLGRAGRSLSEVANQATDNLGYTFAFSSVVLGALPTHVGIVWTDGSPSAGTQLEVFDAQGASLGIIGPFDIGDNSFTGGTAEDRFFGAIVPGGISRIVLRSLGGQNSLEADHLQYGNLTSGTVVPEPGTFALIGLVGVPFVARLARRRK